MVPPKEQKKQNVTFIYFIDAAKTRSFTVSKTKLSFLLVSCLSFVFAGLFSGYKVYLDHNTMTDLEKKVRHTQKVVFEYETKYDSIYELAYKEDDEIKPKTEVKPVEAKAVTKPVETIQTIEVAKNRQSDHQGFELAKETEQSAQALSLKEKTTQDKWSVSIEEATLLPLKMLDDKRKTYELHFAIRNLETAIKSEGYIWSIATLVTKDGKKFYVSAPKELDITNQGALVLDQKEKLFEPYSIKYYKVKNLNFIIPKNIDTVLAHLTIGMKTKDQKKEMVIDIPIQSFWDLKSLPLDEKKFKQTKETQNLKKTALIKSDANDVE